MEKNEDDNNESNNNSKKKEGKLPFGSKENAITVLNDLFKHGQNLPFNSILGMSVDERQSKMHSALELTQTFLENKPSIVGWLRSNVFEESECNVPMALLFIALYEQHSLPHQKKTECDFSEVYQFLYKMTTNQPAPQLSHNSATVLHKLLSEIIEEVWPNTQPDLLRYLKVSHHVMQQRTTQTSIDIPPIARFVIVVEIFSVFQNAEFLFTEDGAPSRFSPVVQHVAVRCHVAKSLCRVSARIAAVFPSMLGSNASIVVVLGNCSATFSPAASCPPLLAVLGFPPAAAINIRPASIFVGYPNLDCTCDPLHDKRNVLKIARRKSYTVKFIISNFTHFEL
ncbi:hypothetical protein ALC57_15120 [Trachymyrmex cornetzi]|uniref:Uncharacterized protein n=1 Tax=Trachymyrmex cornetzi TaxID=471704 RepID=A0A151IXF1_9HYME|nr:hypothetical protein ALC57_15120 [Trachymyrmex cornetzi]